MFLFRKVTSLVMIGSVVLFSQGRAALKDNIEVEGSQRPSPSGNRPFIESPETLNRDSGSDSLNFSEGRAINAGKKIGQGETFRVADATYKDPKTGMTYSISGTAQPLSPGVWSLTSQNGVAGRLTQTASDRFLFLTPSGERLQLVADSSGGIAVMGENVQAYYPPGSVSYGASDDEVDGGLLILAVTAVVLIVVAAEFIQNS